MSCGTRQSFVDGEVPFAGVEDGQAGLGLGDNPRPAVHSGAEGFASVAGKRRDAAVEAVVVDDVRAAADHEFHAGLSGPPGSAPAVMHGERTETTSSK